MICWTCKRVFGLTDARQHTEAENLRQTEYKCTNCGTIYLVSERRLNGPAVAEFVVNEPHK